MQFSTVNSARLCNPSGRALWTVQQLATMTDSTDGIMMKKFTYSMIGFFLFLVSGGLLSGALEPHSAIAAHLQRFNSFPESGWLIVLGSLLISGATFLRRSRATRSLYISHGRSTIASCCLHRAASHLG